MACESDERSAVSNWWWCVSTKPGMTILPAASITVAPGASMEAATSTIFDPSISTSPETKLPTASSIDRTTPPLMSVRRPASPTPFGNEASAMACAVVTPSGRPFGIVTVAPPVAAAASAFQTNRQSSGVAALHSLHMSFLPCAVGCQDPRTDPRTG